MADSVDISEAIDLLGEYGNRSDPHRLKHALHDPEWVVRADLCISFADMLGEDAWKIIVDYCLKDSHPIPRRNGYCTLGTLNFERALPLLQKALLHETYDCRVSPLSVFPERGDQEALTELKSITLFTETIAGRFARTWLHERGLIPLEWVGDKHLI